MRIVCDSEKCSGCLACVITCLDHHAFGEIENAVSPRLHKKIVLPSGFTRFETKSCRHCENAPCLSACPTHAIRRSETGWVVTERELCIGCRRCSAACPFDIPRYDGEGKMVKCDGCGGDANCVRICPNGALSVQP